MKNNPDFTGIWKRIVAAIRGFCTKNLVIKVVALLFAILLWGYVLTDLKPYRTKTVTNVATSFEGEAELLAQGRCVRGDRAENSAKCDRPGAYTGHELCRIDREPDQRHDQFAQHQ